jgi:hypothetical protein
MPGMTTGGFVAARAQPNLLLTTTAMSSSSSGGAGSTAWMHFIETFRFQPGTTPLADFYVPLLTCCTYLLTLVVLKAFIQHRGKAFDLKHVSARGREKWRERACASELSRDLSTSFFCPSLRIAGGDRVQLLHVVRERRALLLPLA